VCAAFTAHRLCELTHVCSRIPLDTLNPPRHFAGAIAPSNLVYGTPNAWALIALLVAPVTSFGMCLQSNPALQSACLNAEAQQRAQQEAQQCAQQEAQQRAQQEAQQRAQNQARAPP